MSSIAGQDTDDDGSSFGNPYYVAGAFAVAGGTITGGEQDFIDYNLLTLTDAITGGAVTISPPMATCRSLWLRRTPRSA